MTPFFLIMSLGLPETIMIAIVGLLLFGRRLPEVGRSVGRSIHQFKRGLGDLSGEMEDVKQLRRDIDAPLRDDDRTPDAESSRDDTPR